MRARQIPLSVAIGISVLGLLVLAPAAFATPPGEAAAGIANWAPLPVELPRAAAFAYRLSDPKPQRVAELPWLSPADTRNQPNKPWLWNTRYRAGRGMAGVTLSEYGQTDLVAKSSAVGSFTNAAGQTKSVHGAKVKDWLMSVTLRGVVFPGVQLWAEAGTSLANIQFEGDANETRFGFGFLYGLGASFAPFTLGETLTPVLDVSFNGWTATESGGTAELNINRTRFDFRVNFEVLSDPTGATLDVYAGVGYHIYEGDLGTAEFHADAQDDLDVLWGAMLTVGEQMAIRFDARFPGMTTFRLSVEILSQ